RHKIYSKLQRKSYIDGYSKYKTGLERKMAEKRKERLQFDFTMEALDRLDKLKEKSGAATRAETIRSALRAYEWIVNELDPDNTITVSKGNNEVKSKFMARLLLK
ncbi:MAG TPA: ribbon-helix-helix protein, CopG family, partial [Methylomirabilota bacterium]|nr:ribbon-helix-helix protein, CopG family [Methylomirabilota bacterium]